MFLYSCMRIILTLTAVHSHKRSLSRPGRPSASVRSLIHPISSGIHPISSEKCLVVLFSLRGAASNCARGHNLESTANARNAARPRGDVGGSDAPAAAVRRVTPHETQCIELGTTLGVALHAHALEAYLVYART